MAFHRLHHVVFDRPKHHLEFGIQGIEGEEIIDGDLFDEYDTEDDEEEEIIDHHETIQKNNEKFLELIKDEKFKILIDIVLNKPEYISYALKFVQSGMIFMKPDNDIPNQPNDYSSQFKILKELNICNDENKLHKVLEIAKGDLQIAIRFLFQDDIDERVEI